MVPIPFRELLAAEASAAGLRLDPLSLDKLAEHYRLLAKWNRAVRLIGTTEPETVIRRHILESLRLIPFIHEPCGALLDIGSGNGFPAIPLKCALPSLRIGMLEPTLRKGSFLSAVAAALDLSDTEVIRGRVDRARDLSRLGRWDCISMRAVAAIPAVLAGAPEALRPGGRLLFMVGQAGRQEILERIAAPLELVAIQQLPGSHSSYIVVAGLPTGAGPETIH